MGFESTAELAFVISTDTQMSEDELAKFRSMMSGTVEEMGREWTEFSESTAASAAEPTDAYAAFRAEIAALRAELAKMRAESENAAGAAKHAVSEMQATSGAIRLLEGNGGIRAMERFTATTLGLGPAMAAIFPVVGAIAFTEIIVKMGTEIYNLYEQWDPVARAEARALETAKAMRPVIQALGEDLRKLNDEAFSDAFGDISGKFHEADEIVQGKIKADQEMIGHLQQRIEAAEKKVKEGDKVDYSPEGFATVTTGAQEAAKELEGLNEQLTAFQLDLAKYTAESSKLIREAGKLQDEQNKRAADSSAKTKEDFTGLTSVMESLKSKLAGTGDAWDRVLAEVSHYYVEIEKAQGELLKLEQAGTITSEAATRETAVLAQLPTMIGQWMAAARKEIDDKTDDARMKAIEKSIIEQEKADDALVNLHRSLVDKLATYDTQDYARKKAQFTREMDDLQEHATKEAALTQAEMDLLAAIRRAGLAKIDNDQNKEFEAELLRLNQHLEKMVEENLKGSEKLELQYGRDLEKWSEAEEHKTLATANGEAARATITALYAAGRKAVTDKYNSDLQALENSQGWQGVFGNKFKSLLRDDEDLMRQWATSTNQSLMLLQVSLHGVKEMGEQAFQSLADGMGQNIAQAIEYGGSIEKAMQQALAATLESIAGQAIAYAIYATALGFLDLALGDESGAVQAFTSAALWGSIGAVAAVAGKYAAPAQGAGSGASGGASTGSRSSTYGGGGSGAVSGAIAGGTAAPAGPTVNVHINGSLIGTTGTQLGMQLADILNQVVYNNDTSLYASHNANGTPLP
jgi:hypothetical protein